MLGIGSGVGIYSFITAVVMKVAGDVTDRAIRWNGLHS